MRVAVIFGHALLSLGIIQTAVFGSRCCSASSCPCRSSSRRLRFPIVRVITLSLLQRFASIHPPNVDRVAAGHVLPHPQLRRMDCARRTIFIIPPPPDCRANPGSTTSIPRWYPESTTSIPRAYLESTVFAGVYVAVVALLPHVRQEGCDLCTECAV